MKGDLVPVVMIPRFTSYVGEGTYTTVPMDVSGFKSATLEFWRGLLHGTVGQVSFNAHFEEAAQPSPPSASDWVALISPISAPNTSSLLPLTFTRQFFRIRIELATSDDTNNLAAITCWAAGSLEKRIPLEGGGS